MRLLFNILAISGSAMFAGVMPAIGVTLGGYWMSLPASDFLDWFNENYRFIMRVVPIVVVPAFPGLAGSLWLGWGEGKERALWIGAILCMMAVLVLTIVWFVPNNAKFAAKSVPLDQVSARLGAWLMIHWVRIGLAAVGSVLGILAVSR